MFFFRMVIQQTEINIFTGCKQFQYRSSLILQISLFNSFWHGRMQSRALLFKGKCSGICENSADFSLDLFWSFWKSIRMVSWLPPIPDGVFSSWSKLSIAPCQRTLFWIVEAIGVRLTLAVFYITLCKSSINFLHFIIANT